MKRTLAALLLATPAFGQEVVVEDIVFDITTPEVVSCPPRYTDMDCEPSVELEPNLWYRVCTSDIRGEEYVWVADEAGTQQRILMPDVLRFSTTLERWTQKNNEHVIDIRFRLTVKRHVSGYGSYNFVTRQKMCPYPYEHVQGNIYWDWTNAYEWYELNSIPEDWQLYQDSGVYFNGMNWKTRGSFGSGGDLYFGCRKIRGKMYDNPSPSFASRDIEWNGETWRYRFPTNEAANIRLQPPCDYSAEEPDSKQFAINMQITMSGCHYISSLDGEMLPQSERIVIPNVVQFDSHAQFVIMDPVECPPKYEEDGGDSSMDEIISGT